MADNDDLSFGKIALQQGYCTQAQLKDALHTLEEVRKLGLNEQLSHIMAKKSFMSTGQVRSVLKIQAQKSKVKIAGYEIVEKVGQGGMGAVFKARQVSLDRIVALKILAPKLAADKAFCERFVKEARAVAKLNHPNIIVGIDVGHSGKYYYFAMEFVDGETALQRVKEKGPFSKEDTFKTAQQIGRALEHAHQHKLVHRDVKPDNIMFTSRGEVKLCDLGLAKKIDPEGTSLKTGTAVGTPHYIAPEQARGESNVDITADIYALGASLYHLTTGRTLFKGANGREIMLQHLQNEAPNARKLRPEISESFCRMLEKMLAKAPQDRYASPSELLADLERIQSGQPVKAPLLPGAKSSMARAPRSPRGAAGRAGRITTRAQKPVGRRTTGPQAPISRGTTGPRKPVARATTGPRSPVSRPDPTTGPKRPIGASKLLLFAGAAVALGAVVGVVLVVGGSSKKAANVARQESSVKKKSPSQASPSSTTRPAVAPDKPAPPKPANVKPANGKPTEKAWSPPAGKSDWAALNTAREAYRQHPDDFANVIGLYRKAEKGAPPGLVGQLRHERGQVEKQQYQAFRSLFDVRQREARTKAKNQDLPGAVGLFNAADIPARLLSPQTRKEIAGARGKYETLMLQEYNKRYRKTLNAEWKAAGQSIAKLQALRAKLPPLGKRYVLPPVKDHLNKLTRRIDQRIRKIQTAAKAAQAAKFESALKSAFVKTAGKDFSGALSVMDRARSDKALMTFYSRELNLLRGDLAAVQAHLNRAGQVLQSKIGKGQKLTLHLGGKPLAGVPVAPLRGKAGAGLVLKSADGKRHPVFFRNLAAHDIIQFSGLKPASSAGRYALGVYFVWQGRWAPAYQTLGTVKGNPNWLFQARFYRKRINDVAARLIREVYRLYREAQNPKLPSAEKKKRWQAAQPLFGRLKNEFYTTEAYRALPKKKKK